MPWVYSNTSGTPTGWSWSGLNTYNQHAAKVTIPSSGAVTQLKAFVAGYNTGDVSARLVLWSVGGSALAQTATFTMADGSGSSGGQYWYTKSLSSAKAVSSGDYWVGVYRPAGESHVFGTMSGSGNGYRKTNTSTWPSVASMSGYNTDTDDEPTVGAFYITAPAAPSSASVSRVSDVKQTISWTNNKDSDQPYDNLYLERYDNVTGSYYAKATLSGSTTSYSDTTTVANRKYRYRIRAKNAAGYSSYAYTDYINTTPSKPTSVTATRVGTTVQITWGNPASNETALTIQRKTSTDNVTWSSYSTLSSALAVDATSYTDNSPANYNKYQVRADTTDPTLHSDYVESNTVQILTPPDVTSNLEPSDFKGVDIDNAIPITWQHNPVDGSAQTYFSIRFREYGGAWSLYVNKYERAESYSNVSTASYTVGQWEYEVRTWGACTTGGESGDGSGYYEGSGYEIGSFTLAHLPQATITQPGVDNYPYSLLTVNWDYTQAESYVQIAYTVKLYDENDNILETKTQSSAGTSVVFNYNLENNTNYKVTVEVQEENGLWSEAALIEFLTEFYVPPTPTFTMEVNSSDGTIVIDITNPSPEGSEVETSYNQLYRSVDGGVSYELVTDEIPVNTAVTDYLPLIGGTTYYKVVAVSTIPSIAESAADSQELIITGRYFLNAGNGYETFVNLRGDTSISETLGNETVLKKFEGRTYPVKYESSKLDQIIDFSCDLPHTDYETLKSLLELTGGKFYRDYKNRWFQCNISDAKINKKDNQAYQFSCTITRVESED